MNGFDLVIVPDEDDPEGALVFVDAKLGSNPYRFLLDTGAATTSVGLDNYTSSLPAVGTNKTSGIYARGKSEDLVTVPEIELGPISKNNFAVARLAEQSTHPLQNLIGMDILRDYCCHFFFDKNRVLVEQVSRVGDNYSFEPLIYDRKFHPYIPVVIGGQEARGVWDTGASITVVDLNFVKKNPAFFEEAGHSQGTDSTGHIMETPVFLMKGATMANKKFPAHKVAGVDLSGVNSTIEIPMDFILGYNTQKKANWVFDFPGKRWAIIELK